MADDERVKAMATVRTRPRPRGKLAKQSSPLTTHRAVRYYQESIVFPREIVLARV
jgi:hypothetical protein